MSGPVRAIRGATPPAHDPDAEAAVLSAVLLDDQRLSDVRGVLRAEHFYGDANRRVYEAILAVADAGVAVDVVAVASKLRDSGRLEQIGGTAQLARLADATPAVAHVRDHAELIIAKWRERSARDIGTALAAGAKSSAAAAAELALLQPIPRALPDIQWLSPDRLLERPPAREWLLSRNGAGVLPAGRVGMLVAAGGAGKTMALCQLALSVACGQPWLDTFEVSRPGAVLLALAEEDSAEIQRRLFAAANLAGMSRDERERAAHRLVALPLAGRHVPLTESDGAGNCRTTVLRDELMRTLDALRVDWSLLVLDPLARFAGADVERDSYAATHLVQTFESLCELRGRPTVLAAHHSAKWARRSDAPATGAEAARGATALTDGVRWVAQLDADGPSAAVLRVTKQNYGPPVDDLLLLRDPEHQGALRPMGETERDDHVAKREERRERRSGRAPVTDAELDERITGVLRQHGPQPSLRALMRLGVRGETSRICARARALGALRVSDSSDETRSET